MKILILSQHLFPRQTPRAHRTTELVKELGRQGRDVTLYAVLGDCDYSDFEKTYNVKIKNIPIKWMLHPYNSDQDKKRTLIDKVLGRLLRKFEFPNIEFLFRIQQVLKKDHDYDVLISIADPHQIHWGVAKLRKKHPEFVPKIWIADCGDPFMLNGSSEHLNYFEKYERLFCGQCDYITVPIDQAKNGYFEEYRNKIRVIPQGFNFDVNIKKSEPKNEIVTFAYAGVFYKDIRNPKLLMEYLAALKYDFRFIVYSSDQSPIKMYKTILGDRLILKDALDRLSLIEELKNHDFLLNLENVNSPAQIPSKLIDYAITGRPILSINPQHINTEILHEFLNKDFKNQFTVPNIEQYHIHTIVNQIYALIDEFKGNE
jgi:hypothetical protein